MLENYTTTEVINYLTNRIAEEKNITKAYAKKLLINAITYNLVIEEINGQIDFLMEKEKEKGNIYN